MEKNNSKGITLIALTITVIILIILASIAVTTGKSSIESSRVTQYQLELEIMETEVGILYEKYKDQEFIDIGKDIASSGKQEQAEKAFSAVGVSNKEGYRLFDSQTISNLNIEGIEGEYLIDIKKRDVISLNGIVIDNVIYYNLQQITGNPKINNSINRGQVLFTVTSQSVGSSEWKITVSNIQYSRYVGRGKLQYKKNDSDVWLTVEDDLRKGPYEFNIKGKGTYTIKITDAANVTSTREITL